MKAMILLDEVQFTEPGEYRTKAVINACFSMGMEVVIHNTVSAASPSQSELDTLIVSEGFDCLVIPNYTGTNRGRVDQFMAGTMSVPVFVCGVVSNLGLLGVTTTYYDGSATFAQAEIVSTGGTIYTNTRRHNLSTETAPAATTAIVRGTGADSDAITAWKYTPDGVGYVYHTSAAGVYNLLHLLVQEAVNDGLISAPPKRAPIILNIDHVNDGGDSPHDGGFQEQPDRLALIGDILRGQKGVCYASPEKGWINDDGVSLGSGTTTGDLLTNMRNYSDVFKYPACHDHNQFYTAGTGANDAVDNQTSKADIDASYQATKTAIEGLGLTVNTDFAHCAGNRFGSNFLELAQADNNYLSDPANTTPKAGYGFKAVRVSGSATANESWPVIGLIPSPSTAGPVHWMAQKTKVRGMVCITNKDGGGANGDIVSLSS